MLNEDDNDQMTVYLFAEIVTDFCELCENLWKLDLM